MGSLLHKRARMFKKALAKVPFSGNRIVFRHASRRLGSRFVNWLEVVAA